MEPLKKQSFSLKSNCKLRLLKDMIGGVRNAHPTALCFLLIIDAGTLRVISSALKMIELMEEGVTAIEKLDLVRKKFPKMHAVYFLSPTEDSVDKLIKDYADPKAPQYGSVHVFFTNHVPNHLFQRVASNKNLVSRVLTLKEFNLDFLCSGDTLFHFDLPQALPVIFSKANTPEEKELSERVGHKLASVIPSLFNYSTVQIVFNKSENNMIAEKVARIAAQRIDQILAAKKPDEDSGDAPHTKIIVLERSFDPLTPLLHDYYYQPMVYDLLNINNDIVEYDMTSDSGEVKKKKVILGDNDDLWEQFRFRHISEAMTGITDKFNDFVKSNSTAKMQRGELGEMNLDKMSEIIRSMPQYNELLSKYTMHMNLIDKCLEEFTAKDLKEIGETEQCLATGVDKEGKSCSNTRLISNIIQRIASGKLNNEDRLRLLMIAAICIELSEKDRKTLTSTLDPSEHRVIQNLIWLGITPQKAGQKEKSSKRIDDDTKKLAKNKLKNISYDLCRSTAVVETIAIAVDKNQIDPEKFGVINLPSGSTGTQARNTVHQITSLRKGKPGKSNWNEASDDKAKTRLIVFVVGGISYAEIRTLKEMESSNQLESLVICGGTSMLKPKDYVDGLGQMLTMSEYQQLMASGGKASNLMNL